MKFSGQILTENEQDRIHQSSLRVLEEIGVRFHGEKALPLLQKAGANVDWDQKIARIPRELVRNALEQMPKAFTLGARNHKYDFPMPAPATRYCIDGTAAFVQDFETSERRYGTSKDIENSLRIFQQMDLGMMAWAPTTASDTPPHTRALHEFFGMVRFSSKHGQHELHTAAQVPYLVEGLSTVEGSEDALKQAKNYSLIYCPVAPLTHEGEMLDAYLALGEFELPVMVMPMPVCGTTGPASLYSNIVVANAENLSSFVIYQLAHPGRWLIYSCATGVLDFTTGGYFGGVPEMGLMSAGLTQMGHFYKLPCSAAGCTADARQAGAQAVTEKIMTTIPALSAGADLIIGTGEIESDQLLILEQIVVDNELGHLCQRMTEGIDCGDEKDFFADIAEVGPGGHFLKAKSTRQAARSNEFYLSRLVPHGSYEAWEASGKPDIYSNARKKVEEILAGPLLDPLEEQVSSRLDEILLRAEKEIDQD